MKLLLDLSLGLPHLRLALLLFSIPIFQIIFELMPKGTDQGFLRSVVQGKEPFVAAIKVTVVYVWRSKVVGVESVLLVGHHFDSNFANWRYGEHRSTGRANSVCILALVQNGVDVQVLSLRVHRYLKG
jgi:hypothetical protein